MSSPGLIATISACSVLAAGCASGPAQVEPAQRLTTVMEVRGGTRDVVGEPIAASALVFAPPVTLSEPPLNLDRAGRKPGAFFGYDDGSIEYYRVTVDDRQVFDGTPRYHARGWGTGNWQGSGSGWYDRYERRAVSERVGAIRR